MKPYEPNSWISYGSSFLVKLEFGMLVFVEERKLEYQEKNPWSIMASTNNNLGMSTIKGINVIVIQVICMVKHNLNNALVLVVFLIVSLVVSQ